MSFTITVNCAEIIKEEFIAKKEQKVFHVKNEPEELFLVFEQKALSINGLDHKYVKGELVFAKEILEGTLITVIYQKE